MDVMEGAGGAARGTARFLALQRPRAGALTHDADSDISARVEAGIGGYFRRPTPSLPESHRTIPIPSGAAALAKLGALRRPGLPFAVGYMDPGKLGDRSRRGLGLRLHFALGHPVVEPDGNGASGARRELGIVTGHSISPRLAASITARR